LGTASEDIGSPNCVKGVVLCKFDLSFGPVPMIAYPADFMTAEQSNKVAMRSMLRLNAAQGKTGVTLSTLDEMGTMGLGLLGKVDTVGFYSFVVFFDINVPRCVSNNIDKVISLLTDINAKFPRHDDALNTFVKQIFMETQELVDQIARDSATEEQHSSKELQQEIRKVTDQITLVIEEYEKMDMRPHRQLADDIMEVVSSLSLVALKYGYYRPAESLANLLMQIERIRYQGAI